MAKRVRVTVNENPSVEDPSVLLKEVPNVLEFVTDDPVIEPTEPPPDEPPLSNDELITIRWVIFGKCPRCGFIVKAWDPPAFNPELFRDLNERGIDPLTGHKLDCSEKWRRA